MTNGASRKFYAGVGSRRTPPEVLDLMRRLGGALGVFGYTLRSGGADGADTAFEEGAKAMGHPFEVYLPWYAFHGRVGPGYIVVKDSVVTAWALDCVNRVHPAAEKLGNIARMLMARNTYQVAGQGQNLLSQFVVCWTPDGAERINETTRDTGGTGQAIRLASQWSIPVFNLQKADALVRLSAFIEESK